MIKVEKHACELEEESSKDESEKKTTSTTNSSSSQLASKQATSHDVEERTCKQKNGVVVVKAELSRIKIRTIVFNKNEEKSKKKKN